MSTRLNAIRLALNELNCVYGKGAVEDIEQCLSGEGRFLQRPYRCRPQWRKFRTIHHDDGRITVFSLGHQKTIIHIP